MVFLVVAENPECKKYVSYTHHSKKRSSNNMNTAKVFRTTFLVLGKNSCCDKIHVVYRMARIYINKQHKDGKAAGNNDRATVEHKQHRTQQQGPGFRGRMFFLVVAENPECNKYVSYTLS